MSAVLKPIEARFEPLTPQWLDMLMAVELKAYAHPWQPVELAHQIDDFLA